MLRTKKKKERQGLRLALSKATTVGYEKPQVKPQHERPRACALTLCVACFRKFNNNYMYKTLRWPSALVVIDYISRKSNCQLRYEGDVLAVEDGKAARGLHEAIQLDHLEGEGGKQTSYRVASFPSWKGSCSIYSLY